MMNSEHCFTTQEELINSLAKSIISNLENAILNRKKASLLLSGGNTPKILFDKLSNIEFEWEKVTIGLCDERWVEPTHKDSNELLVKTYFLKNYAKKAKFIGMYNNITDKRDSQIFSSKVIKDNLFPFDVVILGMGEDGHTASLFPNNEKLPEAFSESNNDITIFIEPKTAPHIRMSLTKNAILSAKHIYLHFEGDVKLKVYNQAKICDNIYKMPISSILNQNEKTIEVYYK